MISVRDHGSCSNMHSDNISSKYVGMRITCSVQIYKYEFSGNVLSSKGVIKRNKMAKIGRLHLCAISSV